MIMMCSTGLCVVLCLCIVTCLSGAVPVGKDAVKTVCDSTSQSQNGTIISVAGKNDSLILDLLYQMNTTINELKKNLTLLQYSKRNDVQHSSFLAVMTDGSQEVLHKGIVRFPVVRHNFARPNFGYDSKISFYRCPADGTYVFGVSLSVYGTNQYSKYSIVKEGSVLASAYTYSKVGYRACSAMVTTPCKKGEDVWVANRQGSTRTVYSDNDARSHFTGFRIY